MEKTLRIKTILSSIYIVPIVNLVFILLYKYTRPDFWELSTLPNNIILIRSLFMAFIPFILVCLVILIKRLIEGSHNPLDHKESVNLKIHARVLQNHLEQFIWFAISLGTLGTFLSSNQSHCIPILTALFILGRLIYWWGYFQNGTLGRSYGVQVM